MRLCSTGNFSAVGWSRIVDYRYSLDPLSTLGSTTGIGLQKQLLHSNWRARPMQFDLPGNSQIFGRWAAVGLRRDN
jgi:hypothetical protein